MKNHGGRSPGALTQRSVRALAGLGMVSLFALSGCESVPSFGGSGLLGTGEEDDKKEPGNGFDNITGLGGSTPATGDGDGDVTNNDVCGNGKLEDSELCDDGNDEGGDGCSSDCSEVDPDFVCIDAGEDCVRVVTCGNGVLEGDEACDDGNTDADDGCSADCSEVDPAFQCVKPGVACVAVPVCGNGIRERGEQCDDAQQPPEDGDGCSATCQQESGFFCSPGKACVELVCGDGVRTPDEECDDGGVSEGCTASCTVKDGWVCTKSGCFAQCGDGKKNGAEQCDDGGRVSGDGCSAACRVEPYYSCTGEGASTSCVSSIVCGNGTVDPGEVCDPAAPGQAACYNSTDNPAQACKGFDKDLVDPPVCGNGVVEIDEDCDGGVGCSDCEVVPGYSCPAANYCFILPVCGDGEIQSGEQCDPGAMSALGCNGCMIETNYYCSGEPSDCVISVCGDGFRAPDEACDDGPGTVGSPGTPVGGDGCSATCTVEAGHVCPPLSSCQPRCGNFSDEEGEQCDEESAGCVNCVLTPGYHCAGGTMMVDGETVSRTGINCEPTVCGDGNKETGEDCDDGNRIAGDGCGPNCQNEPTVTVGPSPIVNVSCGDGLKTGAEQCDDGNSVSGDGCTAGTCQVETGWYCSDDFDYPDEIDFKITYRDFKQRDQTGGHPHMRVQGTGNPGTGYDGGIVGEVCSSTNSATCGRLDFEGKPEYAGGSHGTIDTGSDGISEAEHKEYFKLWYRDTNKDSLKDASGNDVVICPNPGLGSTCSNTTTTDTITLKRVGTSSAYDFNSTGNVFYPLGHAGDLTDQPLRGFGYTPHDSGTSRRNWHFTSELRYYFQYQGGETLLFNGDDDVWVFINGRLAVDIGGIHGTEWGRVVLGDDGRDADGDASGTDSDCTQNSGKTTLNVGDCVATSGEVDGADNKDMRFDLSKGGVYEIVIFQAERHPTGSNYRLTLDGFIAPRSSCGTDCGDSVTAGNELCDDGRSMPASGYGVCLQGCVFEFCGDGVRQAGEQCDNGTNGDTYDFGQDDPCAPGCVLPGFCDDGIVQSAFEVCDDGVNDGAYGGCESDCQSVAGYCGDGTPDAPQEQCDTPGSFTNYRAAEGACGFDCKNAGYCGDGVRNGDELCDDGDDNGTVNSNCNSLCEFEPYCGDGLKTSLEACDYGTFAYSGEPEDAPYGGCTDECELGPRCGDGAAQTDDGEECDDGAANVDGEYGKCTTDCFNGPSCGDGEVQSIFGEACDNGFNEDDYAYKGAANPCGPGCSEVPKCGDGVVQDAFELCDNGVDNNDSAYDGCTTECAWGPYCGDGETNGSETCDNGAANVAYSSTGKGPGGEPACSLQCSTNVPRCGDGERNGPEQCDLGEDNNTGEYGGCKADCTRAPRCGDGVVDEGEACDAGPSGSLTCSPACALRQVVK